MIAPLVVEAAGRADVEEPQDEVEGADVAVEIACGVARGGRHPLEAPIVGHAA
jgi:hypothetical protein